MLLLHDNASFLTHDTDTYSQLSLEFQFDNELLSSRVYQRCLRDSLEDSIRRQKPTHEGQLAEANPKAINVSSRLEDRPLLIDDLEPNDSVLAEILDLYASSLASTE